MKKIEDGFLKFMFSQMPGRQLSFDGELWVDEKVRPESSRVAVRAIRFMLAMGKAARSESSERLFLG